MSSKPTSRMLQTKEFLATKIGYALPMSIDEVPPFFFVGGIQKQGVKKIVGEVGEAVAKKALKETEESLASAIAKKVGFPIRNLNPVALRKAEEIAASPDQGKSVLQYIFKSKDRNWMNENAEKIIINSGKKNGDFILPDEVIEATHFGKNGPITIKDIVNKIREKKTQLKNMNGSKTLLIENGKQINYMESDLSKLMMNLKEEQLDDLANKIVIFDSRGIFEITSQGVRKV